MKGNKGMTKSALAATAEQAQANITPTTYQPAATAPVVTLTLGDARTANARNAPVDLTKPERAKLVRPSKGANKERRKVFGYDNGEGGKVPVDAKVVVVNAGGLKASYPALHDAVEASPTADVKTLKTSGVSGKSFRRAFRSGLIRFAK